MIYATKTEGCDCRDRQPLRALRFLGEDAGQSLVELALVLPVFVLLILGAVEFGELAYAAIEVSDAARAGVQYGAQSPVTAADSAGMVAAAQNNAPDISGLTVPTATSFCSCSNAANVPVPCSTAATSCSRVLNYVDVKASAQIAPLVSWLGSFTLTSESIMRVE